MYAARPYSFRLDGWRWYPLWRLNDFGEVSDPAEGFVIYVNPSDGELKVVGSTFREFLALFCVLKEGEIFGQFDLRESDEYPPDWVRRRQAEWFTDGELREVDAAIAHLKASLSLPDVLDPIGTLRRVQRDRYERVSIMTLDGIGILRTRRSSKGPTRRTRLETPEDVSPAELAAFASKASYDEKLALCRDAQHSYVLSVSYDHEVLAVILGMLEDLGLEREARNLRLAGGLGT